MQLEYVHQTLQLGSYANHAAADLPAPAGSGWTLHSVVPLPTGHYESIQTTSDYDSNRQQSVQREIGRTTTVSMHLALVVWMREKRMTDQESRF